MAENLLPITLLAWVADVQTWFCDDLLLDVQDMGVGSGAMGVGVPRMARVLSKMPTEQNMGDAVSDPHIKLWAPCSPIKFLIDWLQATLLHAMA